MEWIELPAVQGGLAVVVIGVLIAVFTGRLLPRWWVEQLRENDLATIARQQEEIREWKAAAQTSEAATREALRHFVDLAETGKVTEQLLRSAMKEGGGSS